MPVPMSGAAHGLGDFLHSIPDDHPIHVALRTYALALSLSLGPALIPFIISRKARSGGLKSLKNVLRRELGLSSFASSMTVAVGGGAALRLLWDTWCECTRQTNSPFDKPKSSLARWWQRWTNWLAFLNDFHRNFISNLISAYLAIRLLQSRRYLPKSIPPRAPIPMTALTTSTPGKPSFTLDLTLLFVVRAIDSLIQSAIMSSSHKVSVKGREGARRKRQELTMQLDAFVFWASSARIMWCFFYQPQLLPRSYNKWIISLANIDPRILHALRALRSGAFSYIKGISTPPDLVSSLSHDLGYPASWGNPSLLPAYGGPAADIAWKAFGVQNRSAVGGLPCELVHGGISTSCSGNWTIRGMHAFVEALALYTPVHILPILLTRPKRLLQRPQIIHTFLSILRSATFLSSFVSSIWLAVCMTRTLILARLFPRISHDFWDGPFGCAFAGSLVCGSTIWIEDGKRRGEMALYVLPRALRACIPESWLRSGRSSVRTVERLAFVLSLATLLTASTHSPESLRGLSRWTLAFTMKGPNAGFWKRKRQNTSVSPTPIEPISPHQATTSLPDTQPSN